MARLDPHSYNDTDQPVIASFTLQARVDFAARVLRSEVEYALVAPGEGTLDLDTRDLAIDGVFSVAGLPLPWTLEPSAPIFGARLRLRLPPATSGFVIRCRTSPAASALQWLTPAQTAGGVEPFLFSQCQAIHARSILPLQDTPRIRIRYRAELVVPVRLRGLMAARFVARSEAGELAHERWEMPEPIPPYLFALAVGRLESRELGPRSRVWAEPEVVDRAAWEFAEVDRMLVAGEALFGPYDWERFDILTMPPSFPYGGMENPRLTFLTPTLLAGDRSLVSVVAHELAHSWTGNLVSNCNAEHFWLNEGWTVFAERRILEVVEGAEAAALHAALGRRALDRAIAQFAEAPALTCLQTRLDGVDPDEAFSQVPYEKGYLFLRALEEAVGRPAFAGLIRAYVDTYRFQSISSDDFLALVERVLPAALTRVDAAAWLHRPGVPDDAPLTSSSRIAAIAALAGQLPNEAVASAWSPTEWQLFLEAQPRPLPLDQIVALDERFQLTARTNHEVLVAWLVLAVESGHAPAVERAAEVLRQVGRMKYLKPLYAALARSPATAPRARSLFAECKGGYHPIARQVIEGVL